MSEKREMSGKAAEPLQVPLDAVEQLVILSHTDKSPAVLLDHVDALFVPGSDANRRARITIALNQGLPLSDDDQMHLNMATGDSLSDEQSDGSESSSGTETDQPSALLQSVAHLSLRNALAPLDRAEIIDTTLPDAVASFIQRAFDPVTDYPKPPNLNHSETTADSTVPSFLDQAELEKEIRDEIQGSIKRGNVHAFMNQCAPPLPTLAKQFLDEKNNSTTWRELFVRLGKKSSALVDSTGVDHFPALFHALFQENSWQGLSEGHLRSLTLKQIEALGSLDTSLFGVEAFSESLYSKLIHKHLDYNFEAFRDLNCLSAAATNLDGFDRILVFVEKLPPNLSQKFRFRVLLMKLEFLCYRRRVMDVELFESVIRCRNTIQGHTAEDFPEAYKIDDALLRQFLLHIFRSDESKTIKDYLEYLPEATVRDVFALAKISYTENGAKWHNLMKPHQIEHITKSILLEFKSSENPIYLDPFINNASTSNLVINAKNIDKLEVNEYDVDSFALYSNDDKAVSNTRAALMALDLSGVAPHRTRSVSVNGDGDKFRAGFIYEVNLDLPWVRDVERGLLVVDVVGGGKKCRAVICKGSYRASESLSSEGHLFTVFDESGNAIVSDYQIFMSGHVYKPNSAGQVLIPFSRQPTQQTIIVSHKDYSFPAHFYHRDETYNLSTRWIFNREAIRAGNVVSVAVKPILSLWGFVPVLLGSSNLSKSVLTVTTGAAGGVKTTKTFENFKVFDDRESLINVNVPDRVRFMQFNLELTIWNASQKEDVLLASQETFWFNSIEDTDVIESAFLLDEDSGYTLRVLGKNGEARRRQAVTVYLRPVAISKIFTRILETDSDGMVILGPLEGVARIGVAIGEAPVKVWDIEAGVYLPDLPFEVTTQEGKQISLPLGVSSDSLSKSPHLWDLTLMSSNPSRPTDAIESYAHKVSIKAVSKNSCNLVVDADLPVGYYHLSIFQKTVRIKVVKAASIRSVFDGTNEEQQTRNQTSDVVPYGLELLPCSPLHVIAPPCVASVSLSTEKGRKGIALKIQNGTASTRVHCILSFFAPMDDRETKFSADLNFNIYPPGRSGANAITCGYSTTQDLSADVEYILKRKSDVNATKIGNTLTKPTVLLDTWETKKTSILDDSLDPTVVNRSAVLEDRALAGSMLQSKYRAMGAAPAPITSNMSKKMKQKRTPESLDKLSSDVANYDFLAQNGPSRFNLKPSANGNLFIALEDSVAISSKCQVLLFVVDERSCTSVAFSLDGTGNPPTHDTTVSPTWRLTSPVTEILSASAVQPQNSLKLPVGCDFSIISDLSQLYSIAESFATSSSESENLSKFRFITRWNSIAHAERLALFSEFSCHELNVFLYFKDPEFFSSIVKPHLKNKTSVSLVDLFLLGDVEACQKKILDIAGAWNQFNLVEALLLAKVLVDNGFHDSAAVQTVRTWCLNYYRQKCIAGDYTSLSAERREKVFGFLRNSKDEPSIELRKRDRFMEESFQPQQDMLLMDAESYESHDESDDDMGFALFDDGPGSATARLRKPQPAFFEPPPETSELSERYYYKKTLGESASIEMNAFWHLFGTWVLSPRNAADFFVSEGIDNCLFGTFTEIMFTLAVSGFGFGESDPTVEVKSDSDQIRIDAKTHCLVYHKEFKESSTKIIPSIICNTVYIDPENSRIQDEETLDWIPCHIDPSAQKFLTGKLYNMQVTITNTMANPFIVSALIAIPAGSLAVLCNPIKTHRFDLQPYTTICHTVQFYFHAAGEYLQYPVHVSDRKHNVVASSTPCNLVAVESIDRAMLMDMKGGITWSYLSAHGTDIEVLEWLENPAKTVTHDMVDAISFRFSSNKTLWESVVNCMIRRGMFSENVWAFAIKHQSRIFGLQWLFSRVAKDSIAYLEADGLVLDKYVNQSDDVLMYWPLINARAHQIGKRARVNNKDYMDTYSRFISYLFAKPVSRHTHRDRATLICYLLLQDRFSEAQELFHRLLNELAKSGVESEKSNNLIQIEYMRVWFAFINPKIAFDPACLAEAREIASRYATYPVKYWRELFTEALGRCKEFEAFYQENGDSSVTPADEDKGQSDDSPTNRPNLVLEPSLSFTIVPGASGALSSVSLVYHNVSSCEARFHSLNLEMEFSARPFVVASRFGASDGLSASKATKGSESEAAASSSILTKPHHVLQIEFPRGSGEMVVDVPESMQKGNVAIEIIANSGSLHQMRVASETSLKAIVADKKGFLQILRSVERKGASQDWGLAGSSEATAVVDVKLLTNRKLMPVASVYVKVYARLTDGSTVFYKDGYTDILGRFDYASLSNRAVLQQVEGFAVLASSAEYGDVVLTAKAPKV
ncbi:hypothetical protein CcCBS67573_g02384 [Chytriomyces confervae]|uniref:Uncharacterized protein n=1 Tax=Chytriomyces confervae TaxID=246404 RepID=A0A507FM13_9FUNG|nr:hypothetical protein CcCBS67573_g02384 [Chytriomyces confervae]